jgi:GNAT superfamily N-acetyltransferase
MSVEVRPVLGKRELRTFVKLPWRLYRDEPRWIPPLLFERRRFLDRSKNPFFLHAEAEYFIAWRDGRPVGRVSAHVDHSLNAFQQNEWGLFGFFECEDDAGTASALLAAAEDWLRERDRDRAVGPMDFTTNDEAGILVDGHERPPSVLTSWQHPYYPRLLEGAGYGKAMDLLMWELRIEGRDEVHPAIWEMAAAVERDHGITIRSMRKRDIEEEVGRFLEVYNAAWERNWGFVPLTEEEVRHYARSLKPILDENWAFIAERDGEVVGAALALPDYNQVLAHLNGRLLPFGWLKALYHRRKIDRVRAFALGVKPAYQHLGIAARLYQCHFDAAERTPQRGAEIGWILETNEPMNRAVEGTGGKLVRRYRVYEKTLRAST